MDHNRTLLNTRRVARKNTSSSPLKVSRGAPFGQRYRDRARAVSYAERVARELDPAEVLVFKREGTLAESRVVGNRRIREK